MAGAARGRVGRSGAPLAAPLGSTLLGLLLALLALLALGAHPASAERGEGAAAAARVSARGALRAPLATRPPPRLQQVARATTAELTLYSCVPAFAHDMKMTQYK